MDASKALALYALTEEGAALARRLARALASEDAGAGHVFAPRHTGREEDRLFDSLPVLLGQTFRQYRAHIFVGAAGIAVRAVAPHLEHKSTDPAVIVCDEAGAFAVSLLSGHWGGGNDLARRVAEVTGGQAVITTATDVRRLPALDVLAREAGCVVLDWDKVKHVNAALLRGEPVRVFDPLRVLDLPEGAELLHRVEHLPHDDDALVTTADWRAVPPAENRLRLAVPALHAGVGCRRGVGAEEIVTALEATFQASGLEIKALADMASVSAKEDEAGLLEAARRLGVPVRFFSPEELADAPVLTPSAMAAQLFGVDSISVCEGAALLAAGGDEATLLVPKERHEARVTVAVAVAEAMLPGEAGE